MNKDVRIDIIYFCTPADWGFESELYGGGYDLRLLTQTASTKTEAVHALSRAVGRSEVILIVGGFYGNIYLPATVAAAIGFSCQRVGLAGAAPEETLVFPAGAVPFALDGCLRGAMLCSGPQMIFFLDEERSGRVRLAREKILPHIQARYMWADPPAVQPAGAAPGSGDVRPVSTEEAGELSDGEETGPLSQNAPDKPLPVETQSAAAAPIKREKREIPSAPFQPIKSERVVLTPRRPGTNPAAGRDLPHIPQVEEPSAAERKILAELPRLRLSSDHAGKAERLPEKLSFPSAAPEPLPRAHVELKDIRPAASSCIEQETAPAVDFRQDDPADCADAEKGLPPVKMEKMRVPNFVDTPKPGDWVEPVELSNDRDPAAPVEDEPLPVSRAAKFVIAVIVIALLSLALWSGYSYFASNAGDAALPVWTANIEGDRATAW